MLGEKAMRPEQILCFAETKRRAVSGREWNVISKGRGVQDEVQDVGKNSLGNSWALIEFRVYLITMGRVSMESDMIKYNL